MQVLIRVHIDYVVTGGQIYETKTVGLQNMRIDQQPKVEKKKMEMKGTSICPKHLMKGLSMKKIC